MWNRRKDDRAQHPKRRPGKKTRGKTTHSPDSVMDLTEPATACYTSFIPADQPTVDLFSYPAEGGRPPMTVTPQSRFYLTKNLLVDVSDIVSIWIDPTSDTGHARIAYRSAPSIWVDGDTANEIAEAVVAYEGYTFARHAGWWDAVGTGVCEEAAK